MLIQGCFEDWAQSQSCAVVSGTLTVDPKGIIPVTRNFSAGICVVVDDQQKHVDLFAFNSVTTFRWMEPLSQWQNTTNLFNEYGKHTPTPEFTKAVERLKLHDFVAVDVVVTDNYNIALEKANGIAFLHSTIHRWNKEVKEQFFDSVNNLQRDVYIDSYIYSMKPNIEYVLSKDTTFKFAQTIGYKFYETVVLGDGFEHDIYRRDKQTIL